jgi:DNA polymerase-1
VVRIINTSTVLPEDIHDQWTRDQIYNGLDCCVTAEVLDAMLPQLDRHTSATYDFSRALQGPALEMSLRGVRVDRVRLAEVIDDFYDKIDFLERNLQRIVLDGVGLPHFNWRSTDDRTFLFYDKLGIPTIRNKGRPTTDRAAREKMEQYTVAKPIITHMNAIADLAEKIKKLKTTVDPDGRIRTTYNIAGTNTGRFSSSLSAFGTGGNLQNVEESLRSIFIADKGMKFAKCDAKSGESYLVGAIEGNLFNDWTYLDAIEFTDIHTTVAKLCWPNPTEFKWTGDKRTDKELAGRLFYRHHSYRQVAKKLGHSSSYGGQPNTLAKANGLPIDIVIAFQPKYFKAFPAHQRWQDHVDSTLRRTGNLVSLTGRKRWFFGRRNDPDVLREAIAYDPQGSLADIVNRAMLHIWRQNYVTIMMHEHDALTFQYPEHLEDEIIPRIMADLIVTIPLKHDRVLRIPYDCKVGWNKGEFDARSNPEGLRDYKAKDERKRQPEVGILDRVIRKSYG